MSRIVMTEFGRFNRVIRDGQEAWLFECPGCGTWASLDDDQFNGRVSVDHAADGCKGGYHETHDYATAVHAAYVASRLTGRRRVRRGSGRMTADPTPDLATPRDVDFDCLCQPYSPCPLHDALDAAYGAVDLADALYRAGVPVPKHRDSAEWYAEIASRIRAALATREPDPAPLDEEASLALSALNEAIRSAAVMRTESVTIQAPLARYLAARTFAARLAHSKEEP